MMRVPETRGARWFRRCARETTARRSKPRRGCLRNILRMIAVLPYRANRQLGSGGSGSARRQLGYGRYSLSFGLSWQLRGLRAVEEVEAAAGGSGRCSVGWVAGGGVAGSGAAPAAIPAGGDLGASGGAEAGGGGRRGGGGGWGTRCATYMRGCKTWSKGRPHGAGRT